MEQNTHWQELIFFFFTGLNNRLRIKNDRMQRVCPDKPDNLSQEKHL